MTERRCACGAVIPARNGPGQPRKKCDQCAPPRNRAPAVAEITPPAQGKAKVAPSVRAELEDADRLDSSAGALAVALAEQLDAGGQTGASAAALSREIRAAVVAALADAAPTGDAVDELRKRREQRRRGA